jgi:hypothetical protein
MKENVELSKNLEGNGHGLIKILSWHLPGRMKENHKTLQPGYLASQLRVELNIS